MRPYDGDRDVGMSHHVFRAGTEEKSLQSPNASAPHHDASTV